MLDELERAGVRGRGGAGFPVAQKLRSVSNRPGPRFVVANGEEGEPASWKDRYLVQRHPFVVIEGIALVCQAIDAREAWIYVSDPDAYQSARSTTDELAPVLADAGLDLHVVRVPHSYVAGEETAAIRYIAGGPPLPSDKPPRPFERGIRNSPTLVNNVETFAHIAWIANHSADAFRSVGTEMSPGTFLACVTGDVPAAALVETPFGTPISSILGACGVEEPLSGALLGGYFSGFLPADGLHLPASDEALRPRGLGLGNGTIIAVAQSRCLVTVLSGLMSFFANASAGQCGPCVHGTAALNDLLHHLATGTAPSDTLERLEHYGQILFGRGACNLLDAVARFASSFASDYPELINDHLMSPCERCAAALAHDPSGIAFTLPRFT